MRRVRQAGAATLARRNVIEVVPGVATKVMMSNSTDHIVHTELDGFVHGSEWTKPAA